MTKFLFHRKDYLKFKYPNFEILTFENSEGVITFIKSGDFASSLPNAPYGGATWKQKVNAYTYQNFYQNTIAFIESKGVKQIKIIPSPFEENILTLDQKINIFLKLGFTLNSKHQNMFIPVSSKKNFSEIIHKMQQRKLRKIHKNPTLKTYTFKTLADQKSVINHIVSCRAEMNYNMSMLEDDLVHLIKEFPKDYIAFCVKKNEQIISSTLCVRVSDSLLYNFLPATSLEYRSWSPIVLLHEKIYNFCLCENIAILDQGLSLNKTGTSESLLQFKERLGGSKAIKLTFSK